MSALSLKEVVDQAKTIYSNHEEWAEADAGFDAGEFSGPAHDRMADEEVKHLAEKNGLTFEDVFSELLRCDMDRKGLQHG